PAMKSGIYPVYVTIFPACAFSPAPCPFALNRQLVDTLTVTRGSAILAGRGATAGFSAAFQGNSVSLTLPEGKAGLWRAELLTLSGRTVAAARLSAAGGSPARLDLGAAPERGAYLLRLVSPEGK